MRPVLPLTLSLYLARMLLLRSLAFVLGLVLVLMTLDLLQESSRILAVDGNGSAQLVHYVSLRLPQLITQFLPFGVLLGSLLTWSTLAQNSEITVLKAAGLSAHRILLPLLLCALAIGGAHFFFNELVTARATRNLAAWKDSDYQHMMEKAPAGSGIWLVDGNAVVHASMARRLGKKVELDDFSYYDRASIAGLRRIVTARTAVFADGRWSLNDVRTTNVATGVTTHDASQPWLTLIKPERVLATVAKPNSVSFWALGRSIRELRAAGHPVDTEVTGYYHKIASALSSAIMPLLGAIAGFGLVRSGRLFIRVVIGMAVGFAYFVADNFMVALGQFGSAPPLLAAWAPLLLFTLIGESILFRTEE